MRRVPILLALVGAALLAPRVLADSWFTGDMSLYEPGRGTLLLPLPEPGRYAPAQGLETRVDLSVTGVLARARVVQRFRNQSPDYQEGIYVFPLPPGAAVDTLRVRIGERVLVGEIQAREAAREQYRRARAQGRKAALVDQARPDVFTTSVANIAPGEEVSVEIEYQERLRWSDGGFELRFPLTVSARAPEVPGSRKGAAPAPAPVHTSDPEEGPTVRLEVDLDAGFPLAGVSCSTHSLQVENPGPSRRVLRLGGPVPADRDLVIRWSLVPGDSPRVMTRVEKRRGARYALVMVQPPSQEASRERRLPREVLLVIDSSGSMKGDRILHARQAVADALERLQPEDRANVLDFDDQARPLWPSSRPMTPAQRAEALDFVRGLAAGGGTNMADALEKALGAKAVTGFLRQVVFVTDGQVSNEADLFRRIRRDLGTSRLFTVGIGRAPNTFFMQRAARHGRGTFTHIDGEGEVVARMQALLRKLETPVLRDLEITWDTEEVQMWPQQVPDLYAGEPLVVLARLGSGGRGLVLRGGGAAPFETRITLPEEGRSGVARLWAREAIAGLEVRFVGPEAEAQRREAITPLALEYGLVSDYTSLVAVEEVRSRPQGKPLETRRIPNQLPADQKARAPRRGNRSGPIQAVPEPEEWAFLLLVLGILTYLHQREEVEVRG